MYYSKLKILHHPDKLDSFVHEEITPPIHIRIKPTNVCNHNCSYCSYQNSYGQLGKDMVVQDSIPEKKLKEIIADCSIMGVEAITFSGGGEPLVYKGIDEMIGLIAENGMKIGLLTNGILLKDKIAEAVLFNCSWVRISMDGWDRKSYAEYRGCPESDFDKLLDNLRYMTSKWSACTIGVNIIIDQKNANHIFDVVKLVYDLGIRSIKLSPCIMSNDAKKNNDMHFVIRPIVIGEFKKLEAAGIKIYNSYHSQLEGFKKDYTWCPYVQILPIIGADQNVYACHDKAYNKDTGLLGSIKDKSFKDFWYDGKDKFYKINPSIHCNHHCVTDNTNKMLLEYLSVEHKEFC